MKRWIFYLLTLAVALFLSQNRSPAIDVGRMEPVEVVRVIGDRGMIIIQTDTGQMGKGEDLSQAISDMKQTASKELFLDTAEFLLVTPSALPQVPELTEILRPSCCICLDGGKTELNGIAAFLQTQKPGVTLRQYRKNPNQLPTIHVREERLYLVQP